MGDETSWLNGIVPAEVHFLSPISLSNGLVFRLLEDRRAGRFQIFRKIINAIVATMQFDGDVKHRTDNLVSLPACYGSRFGGLISEQNQHGADL